MSAEAKPAAMICPACNTRYDEGGAFCSRDGTPLVKDPQAMRTDLVGQVLADRYRVVRLIGEGGMGQVYEAQHVNINKRFALKLLRPEIVSNGEAVARFRQEAWASSSIGHENIVEIEDFATLPSGAVYLAMEFLEGLPLSERMRRDPPLTFAESLDVMLQVVSGLAAAHDKGIVHRDMKPENVFLGMKYGRPLVKILDFGIAKVSGAEGNKSLTRTGTIFGTPHYMSPEQALGKPLDLRADIYSVGIIMYELFTGKVPFEAESFMGILTKHITTQPTPPRQVAPEREIPDVIEAVILRALAKEADERYQTMGELGAELASIAAELAPEALQPRPSSQALAQIGKPQSVVMSARNVTPRPTPLPGARPPSGATAVPPANVAAADGESQAPKKKSAMPYFVVAGVLVAAAAGAVVWVTRTPAPQPQPPVVQKVEPPPVETPSKPEAPAPVLEEVIVDSVPPGAKIWVDGAPFADTPETVKVEKGKTRTVVLKKDGFVDQEQTVDPDKSHKLLVHLERVKKAVVAQKEKPGKAVKGKLPVPPPASIDPPAKEPKPVVTQHPATPPKKKHSVVDPYERVDETPPKKSNDVLNPY
ncbi:MAG TPA: serine/threonine-protein kinase [Polyangia bacterium]|nr:serine/threonine-protein kinase [Polyangia bacterium]